ncbi:glycoside hydrolase family 13 protein [Thermofilum pendens]|uniref:Alpha amylase, catalytic region n=1 Tax=Thermofilum pendens (strain DSM 2475 / Hrk 5) TaxID=368408 RepID=A1S075_THEPD|nr:glycoside hydrolase family 13 protein [Thermofilum pendens]ABL78855.1 alpha amylase, catalytic region [Thermofilum pendens Hrk 5]
MYRVLGFRDDVYLGRVVKAEFSAPREGEYAYLLGNFNAFNEGSFRMRGAGDRWVVEVELPEGVWYYLFSLGGRRAVDPENPETTVYSRRAYKFEERVSVAKLLGFDPASCNGFCEEALYHYPSLTYVYPFGGVLFVRLRALRGSLQKAFLVVDGRRLEMRLKARDEVFDYYEASLEAGGEVSYYFEVLGGGRLHRYGEFSVDVKSLESLIRVPEWVYGSVFYQIMPDRFAEGGLEEIAERLNHVSGLGANALYLTPIFESTTYHGYDVVDYYRVAGRLGGDEAFGRLLAELKKRGMRVVLDGVFHHTSFFHPYFQDLVEKGEESRYKGFYRVLGFPVVPREFLEALRSGAPRHELKKYPRRYESFFDVWLMPRLNHDNPEVRSFITGVGRYWVSRGVDGWRLDVAHGVPPELWREFRETLPGDVYLFGEVMDDARIWLFDKFHGAMNYLLYDAVLRFFAYREITAEEFLNRLELLSVYYGPGEYAMYNFLDNHDVDRLLSLVGDRDKYLCALVFLFTYKGVPSIYYGDEVGLENTDSPFMERSRAPMRWDESTWDKAILEATRALASLRRRSAALQRGAFEPVRFEGGLLVYRRRLGDESILVAINYSESEAVLEEPAQSVLFRSGSVKEKLLGPFSSVVAGDR